MIPTRIVLMLVLMLTVAAAWAAKPRVDLFPEDAPNAATPKDLKEPEPWKEGESTLPPYPEEADLIEYEVEGEGSAFHYYVDGKHLAIGNDGVVRYTLVIVSRQGARNVFFEGLRCDADEYKTYAFGTSRDQFRPMKSPVWMRLRGNTRSAYRQQLRQYFLCDLKIYRPHAREKIIDALKSGRAISGTTYTPY